MKVFIMLMKITVSCMFAKAFDKVWHEGLFIKPFEMGIGFYLWKIVDNMHVNLRSYVLFRSFKSEDFNISRGDKTGSGLIAFLVPLFPN